jgi:hypothetical protein
MGLCYKEKVQLVISHLEGCSGNFLARLYADYNLDNELTFKVGADRHPKVLAINGRQNFKYELSKLNSHIIVVTHNFDLQLLRNTFPYAKIIQIYPYNKVGNVLYNISYKKLTTVLSNTIDNHIIHIVEWKKNLDAIIPASNCVDYAALSDQTFVESLLDIKLNKTQLKFFNDYHRQQIPYTLNWPTSSCSIHELINTWGIVDWFNAWSIAFTISVFEDVNGYKESQRLWSIDTYKFITWIDVINLESKYQPLCDCI